ncbi:flagellin [Pelotalea chapellei]|uniref:Flagellin n=1 Tax=Pelotalea chapellei TaxID=44671 RepID=A0ABS5U8D3_9BACT|nr:flagellin [Pelotalea chapellei]MBT1071922.1 flagellar biosynthesis protein FlgL [Pelotalea chapellei]
MRVTANMSADSSLYNIQQGRKKLDRLQELTSSGSYINKPSDDPIGSNLLLDVGDKLRAGTQYLSNIKKSQIWQEFANTALTGMADTMRLAKQQVATITAGSNDPVERQNAVSQLQTLKQQMIDMGNIQMGDQYLFGGVKNTTAPFSATAPYYSGDESALKIEVGPATTQQMNIPGNQLLTADTATTQPYGTTNILQTFDDLIAAVTANNVAGIKAGATALGDGAKQITNAQTDVASRIVRLDSTAKLNNNTRNTLETIYGNTQNVDYAKLAVQLNQQKIAFEASLSSTAKLSQLSLLDYM